MSNLIDRYQISINIVICNFNIFIWPLTLLLSLLYWLNLFWTCFCPGELKSCFKFKKHMLFISNLKKVETMLQTKTLSQGRSFCPKFWFLPYLYIECQAWILLFFYFFPIISIHEFIKTWIQWIFSSIFLVNLGL